MTETQRDARALAPRYDFAAVDFDSRSVHADVVRLVGEGARVLELGPATGYMSRAFRERDCSVVGIEIDPGMAERAEEFCERVVVGDLDTLDLSAELGEDRFDAIVAADVLEHLKDPLAALQSLRPFLKDDGTFVLSIPNVAHGSVRLALLTGHFDYRDIGLLDSTHLRFFTRDSLLDLLDEAELGVIDMHRHELAIDASEVPFDAQAVPAAVREELERDPDARTYQFVVKAIPMEREGLRELQARLREMAELRVKAERVEELEKTLAEIAGREGELRKALIEAHDRLLRHDRAVEERDQEIEKLHAKLAALGAEASALGARLDRLHRSPLGRLYAILRSVPMLRARQQRRKAAAGQPGQG